MLFGLVQPESIKTITNGSWQDNNIWPLDQLPSASDDDWKLILSYVGRFEGGNWGYDTIHNGVRSEPIRSFKITENPNEKMNLASEYPEKEKI